MDGCAISVPKGYRHPANQELMCGKELIKVQLGFCDGPRRKAEDVLAVEYRGKALMKLLTDYQERKADGSLIFRCVGIVVMACKCGDPAGHKDKTSNLVEDLAWHLEEIGWFVVLEVGSAFRRYLSVGSIGWLRCEMMGEGVGISVRSVASSRLTDFMFVAHYARVR